MSSLLHVFGSASPDSRNLDIKKLYRKKRNTKRFLLRALESWTDRTSGGTADMNSSDAEKGFEGEGSSIDEDDVTLQSTRGDKQRKLLPTSPHTLPSSLMRALTIPPPSPSSMTSEDFIRDFLSKYPPSPKSYEVTVESIAPRSLPIFTHLLQLSIGNKVRRLSKQVLCPFLFSLMNRFHQLLNEIWTSWTSIYAHFFEVCQRCTIPVAVRRRRHGGPAWLQRKAMDRACLPVGFVACRDER